MTKQVEQADVVVLGMGPGGEEVAGRLALAELDVIGIDGMLLGGECPYWGCIPSKMMIRAANLLAEGRRIPGMAGTSTITPDWAPVARRIRDEATDNWDDQVAVDRFVGKGGRFVRGWGTLDGPSTGRGRRRDLRGPSGRGHRRRRQGVGAAHPGPGRPRRAVLDQPRRHRGRVGPGVTRRPRGRGHRCRARTGLRPVRRGGVDRRGSGPAPRPRGARVEHARRPRRSARRRGHPHLGPDHRGPCITGVGSSSTSKANAPVTGERLLVATGRRPDLGALNVTEHRRRRDGPGHSRRRPSPGHRRRVGGGRHHRRWGPSPTSRCTRPTSPSRTSWATTRRRPTTGPCPGSPSPIPRSARWD